MAGQSTPPRAGGGAQQSAQSAEHTRALDRLARLAARMLQAPIGLVTLFDGEHSQIAGFAGSAAVEVGARPFPAPNSSLCQRVRASAAPLALADMAASGDHLCIAGVTAAAFLGVPLIDPREGVIGTLCVVSEQPRVWGDDDPAALSDLAASVITEITLRRDLAAREQAEAALREREQRLRMVAEHIDAVLWTMDPTTGELKYGSPAIEQIWGRSVDEFTSEPDFLLTVHPEDRSRAQADFDRQKREPHLTEYRVIRPDGRIVWVRDRGIPIVGADGEVVLTVGIMLDITAEKEAREALVASQEQYRLLFESNPQPMWVYDRESLRFLTVNDAAVALYGYSREEFLDMTIRDIRPEDEVPALLSAIAEAGPGFQRSPRLWRHRARDGRMFMVESSFYRIEFDGYDACLVMVSDVTDRQRLESQLMQAQKLESLGRLAGSVAHDFNNVLTAISGSAYFLSESLPERDERLDDVREIVHAVEHATSLTRQLLAFARRQFVEPKVLNLNEQIQEVSRLLRRLIGDRFQIEISLDSRLEPVRIDPGQFEQLLLNLAVNARDAMPRGGRLRIDTRALALEPGAPAPVPVLMPGRYAQITVSDTGVGMTPDVQAHIFEPFFTTKEPGKGTGLGLAVCHGIVKQAGGDIWVRSTPGSGTAFTIILPYAEGAAGPEREQGKLLTQGGREVVLLAEDDPMVREATAQSLRAYGYTVLVAEDGPSALALAMTHDGPIDLLVTDLTMPYMGGHTLAAKLCQHRPHTAVLYMTGYADADDLPAELPEGAVLHKPFTPSALARRVREQLDGRR